MNNSAPKEYQGSDNIAEIIIDKLIAWKVDFVFMDAFEQEEIGGKQFGIDLHPINFVKIAEACGAEGYTCSDPVEFPFVLSKAFASSNPAVIEVDVDPDAPPDPPEKLKA